MIEIGKTYEVRYPFHLESYRDPDEYNIVEETWCPGCIEEEFNDDVWRTAHGEGYMLLTVVDVHKPGRFPTRVFYTRKWRDPDGKEFGKGGLKITTLAAFNRRVAGYLYEYEIEEPTRIVEPGRRVS